MSITIDEAIDFYQRRVNSGHQPREDWDWVELWGLAVKALEFYRDHDRYEPSSVSPEWSDEIRCPWCGCDTWAKEKYPVFITCTCWKKFEVEQEYKFIVHKIGRIG